MNVKILDKKQAAKVDMMDVVIEHLDENPAIVALNVAFKDGVDEVKPVITEVKATAQEGGAVTTGIAAGKQNFKQIACEKAAKTAGQVFAYAVKIGDAELQAAVDFSETDLKNLKSGEIALRCQAIHDLAVEHKDPLTDYGVTDAKLAALQTAIDDYAESAPKPRAAITDRSVLKAKVRELLARADKIFTKILDRLINDYEETHPEFVAAYKAKRKIVDPKPNKPKNGNGNNNGGNTPA